ncbi:sialidase-4-like [Denticeps clupeoides]|uniref:exo-alpha-sialidase n=1 Tax=Denticeps clupeoides TaxID=299321 RepID=A0AAY4A3V3_9TELE|nr:sialidase-3 [Denticeps clupeoides]XP_028839599.1 sialidase-3 [Denticeps clupeoides]XP_028839600.1 sialidase-3 [Denticeps clupeoides]
MATTSNISPQDVGEPARTAVFKQDWPLGTTYRIPALIYIPGRRCFLAFAEKRSSPQDTDALHLVLRKGTLEHGTVQWLPCQDLTSACLINHRTMNPCPVFEKASQTIFLFFICILGKTSEHNQICTGKNKARLCYVTSSDYGQTWSEAIDLTESVIGSKIKRWATFAVGPGHGIQTESTRLIIPAYVYYIHQTFLCFPRPCSVKPHAFCFYSDDYGTTWNVGRILETKSCECEMAEILSAKGKYVYCNARNIHGHRVEALSTSDGMDFAESHLSENLVEPCHGCQGSVVSFTAPTSGSENKGQKDLTGCDVLKSNTWLLYSHPTSRHERRDLGVYLNRSPLDPSRWEKPWIIHSGPSGYSDLACCDDECHFACLVECGRLSNLEEILFVYFNIKHILEYCK